MISYETINNNTLIVIQTIIEQNKPNNVNAKKVNK